MMIATIVIFNYCNYPSTWDKIQLGQERISTHLNLGSPNVGAWAVKGDIWFKDSFLSWHRLDIFYNGETMVYAYYISYYIGTQSYYYKFNVKSKFKT